LINLFNLLQQGGSGEDDGCATPPSGRKRKRIPRSTGTPLVGVELKINALEVEQVQASSVVQPNGDSEVVGDGEDRDIGDGWEDEMDEEDKAGCVPGQIEPRMTSGFLHGEENS
jgi:hypothetical protein